MRQCKLEWQLGNAHLGSKSSIFRIMRSWNLMDDLEKQKGTSSSSMLLQTLCIILKPFVNLVWKLTIRIKIGYFWFYVNLPFDLWPFLPFCIDNQIISHSCNYSWKCHDYMTWTLWTRCSENYNTPQQAGTKPYLVAKILATKIGNLWASVAVNYQYSRYKIDMTNSIDNQYGFHNIDI